jgi:hypothetical protein
VITAAALLVLVALGLFVWGIAAGATALYWACVAVSAVAAVLLVVAFLRMRSAVADAGAARQPTRPEPDEVAVRQHRRAEAGEPAPPVSTASEGTGPASTRVLPVHAVPDEPATGSGEPGHAPEYASAGPGGTATAGGNGFPVAPADGGTPGPAGETLPATDDGPPAADGAEDPAVEEVEVTDLLLVVDLRDEVLVVDEHPRYHLAGCSWLGARETVPLPVDEARTDGFTPCAVCAPDRALAERERARRASGGAP